MSLLERSRSAHPYRQATPPRPRPLRAPATSVAAPLVERLCLAALLGLIAWTAAIAWHEHRLDDAVHALPPPLQQAAYRRARDELTSVCPRPGLEAHCRDEAALILRLPQCDADCRALARRQFSAGAR